MSFHNENGYMFAVKENLVNSSVDNTSVSLTDPSNVFLLQNQITDKLNTFQTKYSRYLRCQDPRFAQNVNPPCDLNDADSFHNVTHSYNTLLSSISNTRAALDHNVQSNEIISPPEHDQNEAEVMSYHDEIRELRSKLDAKLNELYAHMDKSVETPQRRLDAAIYANTLWVILASCLVYFVIVKI
jgi:hypothetical protein